MAKDKIVFARSIRALDKVVAKLAKETWADEKGRKAVITGVRLAIAVLKDKDYEL